MHKLLKRQLKKICPNGKEALETNKDFKIFLDSISMAYTEYDKYEYTLERSLELSFQELESLQLAQKNSYDSHTKAMVRAMPDMLFLNNEDGVFLEAFINKNEALFSSQVEIVGKDYGQIFSKKLEDFFCKNLKKSILNKKLNVVEFMLEKEKQHYEARLISANYLIEGRETVITIIRNITAEKKIQEQLQYIALYDDLTKLPNRFYFQKKLKESIKEAKRKTTQGALFFLDVDQFKVVNDNLGHDIGDKILLKIIKRLKSILSKKHFLARFGGDEFVLIVTESSDAELKNIADLIMEQFVKPLKVEKYVLDITTSVGICTFPKNISSSSQLLKQADIAMYKAKDSGRNTYRFFTQKLAEKAYEEFILEVKLKKAIEKNEFYLLYQPQIRLSDNKLIGVEALIRWKSNALVSPLKFIPIAEQCGFIDQISDWVLESVCKQINLWKEQGLYVEKVAINLSRRELGKKNLLSQITKILDKYAVCSSSIELEVTETALFANRSRAFKNIALLQEKGFSIAIDDFGTGYSSLSNLKEFLFDKLKIDRSFIEGIEKKKESEAIVKATIAIAKSLNLKVVAEGVETFNQLAFLKQHDCDEVQGYYYSRPILAKDVFNLYKGFSIMVNKAKSNQ